ncbi:MAG: hypothetical protein WD206_01735 [Actinomycetota bacterium]
MVPPVGLTFVTGGAAHPRFLQPPRLLGIVNKVKEPAEHPDAVTSSQAESRRVWRKRLSEMARVVEDAAESIGNDAGNGRGILPLEEQVGGYPRGASHWHAAYRHPFILGKAADMETHVRPARLFPSDNRELVAVSRKVAQTIEPGGGSIGYDSLGRRSLPRWNVGGQLEPGGAQGHVVWDRGRGKPIYAVGDALEE